MATRIFHFGNRAIAKHNGIVTVAAELLGDRLYFGISYCSPKDRFKRKLGIQIAKGRLKNGRNYIASDVLHYADKNLLTCGETTYINNSYETIKGVLRNANLMGRLPKWFNVNLLLNNKEFRNCNVL